MKGCENSPANANDLQQLGRFIPTAIMGNDSRCPFFFDENASEEDKALFGVGEFLTLAASVEQSSEEFAEALDT
ncbi:MAG: hypothetical protein IPL83_08360 [Bdellovibrionales bacterium]|nr:hypothetical protein [Bdellovibrionales bacterium]